MAVTRAAPCDKSASVKPPVDAPTSMAAAPRIRSASRNRSIAASSLSPARETVSRLTPAGGAARRKAASFLFRRELVDEAVDLAVELLRLENDRLRQRLLSVQARLLVVALLMLEL